uniref:Nitrile hydratase beta-like protein n=1 Tax=Mesorhizobium sp. F28 TaxID=491069 RepID=B0FL83_9HYPH|nr:nitrile hydratase beta-like protein [Mesorhizobium sp. F28]
MMTDAPTVRLVRRPTPEDRAAVEPLIAQLPGGDRPGDRSFDEPWQLRAFALAVTAHKAGRFEWAQFQAALIASIKKWEETHALDDPSWAYYEHWVAAFETVLAQIGLLDTPSLESRTAEVLAAPPNHHEAHRDPIAVHPGVKA